MNGVLRLTSLFFDDNDSYILFSTFLEKRKSYLKNECAFFSFSHPLLSLKTKWRENEEVDESR